MQSVDDSVAVTAAGGENDSEHALPTALDADAVVDEALSPVHEAEPAAPIVIDLTVALTEPPADGQAAADNEPVDTHIDKCFVCTNGGNLLCCDTCNLAYHHRCTGVHPTDPNLDFWQCKVCTGEWTPSQLRQQRQKHWRHARGQLLVRPPSWFRHEPINIQAADIILHTEHEPTNVVCAFCRQAQEQAADGRLNDEHNTFVGPYYDADHKTFVYVHSACAIWCPRVYYNVADSMLYNVMDEVKRSRRLRCAHCSKYGATIGCSNEQCAYSYHYQCARDSNCKLFVDQFRILCPEHAVKHTYDRAIKPLLQPIIDRNREVLQHNRKKRKRLMQQLASNDAGDEESNASVFDLSQGITPTFTNSADVYKQYLASLKPPTKPPVDAPPALALQHNVNTGNTDTNVFDTKAEVKRLQKLRASIQPMTAEELGMADADVSIYVPFARVGSLQPQLQSIYECTVIPLLYPDIFLHMNIRSPRGILLHGSPGCGKTLVARELARTCVMYSNTAKFGGQHISFFSRKANDILNKHYGETERHLQLIFARARECAPSIILFDEIDALVPSRSPKQNQVHNSIVTTMLSLMDGIDDQSNNQVMVIATTNRPDAIDSALRRPGRFDREIHVPLPDSTGRKQIFSIHTQHFQPAPTDEQLNEYACRTAGYSGADIAAVCSNAMLHAVQRTCPSAVKQTERDASTADALQQLMVTEDDWLYAFTTTSASTRHSNTLQLPKLTKASLRSLQPLVSECRSVLAFRDCHAVGKLMLQPSISQRNGAEPVPFAADRQQQLLAALLQQREFEQCTVVDASLPTLSSVVDADDRVTALACEFQRLHDAYTTATRSVAGQAARKTAVVVLYISTIDEWLHHADRQLRNMLIWLLKDLTARCTSTTVSNRVKVTVVCTSQQPWTYRLMQQKNIPQWLYSYFSSCTVSVTS